MKRPGPAFECRHLVPCVVSQSSDLLAGETRSTDQGVRSGFEGSFDVRVSVHWTSRPGSRSIAAMIVGGEESGKAALTDDRPLSGNKVLKVAYVGFVPSPVHARPWRRRRKIGTRRRAGPHTASRRLASCRRLSGHLFEIPNRGKRSVAINLRHPDGRSLVLDVAAQATSSPSTCFRSNGIARPRGGRRAAARPFDLYAIGSEVSVRLGPRPEGRLRLVDLSAAIAC